MDPESFFRSKIDGMLLTASWVEKVKEMLGLTGVSQVWGEKPGWYFWISHAPGVYHLQMEDAYIKEVNGIDLVNGIFSIKCYPFAQEKVFHSFSFEERGYVESDFFDHTNTPRIERQNDIPESLFNIGTLEYTLDTDDSWSLFTFESLGSLRIRYEREAVQEYPPLKKKKRLAKGELGRNVPGWELGYPLFDRLLSLSSNLSKRKPIRVIMTSSPGFEYVYDKASVFQCLEASDIEIYSLTVLFTSVGRKIDLECDELITEQLRDGCQEVIYDRTFQCGHLHHDHEHLPLATSLNELWWSLADAN